MVKAHKEPAFDYVDLSGSNDDAIALWLQRAKPGDWMCYYRGSTLASCKRQGRAARMLALADTVLDPVVGSKGAGVLDLVQFKITGGRTWSSDHPTIVGDYLYLACRRTMETRHDRPRS